MNITRDSKLWIIKLGLPESFGSSGHTIYYSNNRTQSFFVVAENIITATKKAEQYLATQLELEVLTSDGSLNKNEDQMIKSIESVDGPVIF